MRKFILLLITILLLNTVSCSLDTSKSITNKAPKEISEEIKGESLKVDSSTFKGLNMQTDNIDIKLDGQDLSFKLPIYLDKNRYFICLNELVDNLDGKITKTDCYLNVELPNKTFLLNITTNTAKIDNSEFPLKKALISSEDFYYINFSDIATILDIYSRWDIPSKTIFCKTSGNDVPNVQPYKAKIDTLGFLRLEDVALSSEGGNNGYLEKLRIIGNYLSKRAVPYHIAWIPRYISPNHNIDIDPSTRSNMSISELIYTLDFISNHNGLIGLHGYTHQSASSNSGEGYEFGKTNPSSYDFRTRIEKAMNIAKDLDIPIAFFEVPHYSITVEQNKIAGEYFKILYYPFEENGRSKADNTKPQLSPYNNSSYYISTPLDYIQTGKEEACLANLKNADKNKMGSIFYHPFHELDSINLSLNNNIPEYTYNDNSILKRLVNTLEEEGFKMSKVSDIGN